MQNIVFYRKVPTFQKVIIVSKLLIFIVTNGFLPKIRRLKMCSLNTLHLSDLLK